MEETETALARMTSSQARRTSSRVLVVPVGATEQHGPHLPLSTDTDIAAALARRLAALAPAGVAVAPAIAYGSSGEHQDFAGTLSIGAEATELLLVELGRSATRTWERVLLLSTHGGNAVPVSRAARQLRAEGRDVRAWSPDWRGDAHAGHSETSIMLSIDAARVDTDQIAAAVGPGEPLATLMGPMRRGGIAAVSRSGVLGDATTAAAGDGERLLAGAAAELAAYVGAWPALDAG
jgi:mycofactocin system creatininase family protein